MKKVPMVDLNELGREKAQTGTENSVIYPMTSLDVGRSNLRPMLFLSLSSYSRGIVDGASHEFVLSPPAAKQLAETLEQAVDEYLHSERYSETG